MDTTITKEIAVGRPEFAFDCLFNDTIAIAFVLSLTLGFTDAYIHLDSALNFTKIDTIPWGLFHMHNARQISDNRYILTGKKLISYPPEDACRDIGITINDYNHNMIKSAKFGKVDTIDFPASYRNLDFVDVNNIFYGGINNQPLMICHFRIIKQQ